MELSPSSHIDDFTRRNLPPRESWPQFEFTTPDLDYPVRLNAATELLDRTVERFGRGRDALRVPDARTWSYGELLDRANQFARLLVEDYGLVPGNRVMLRLHNNPWAVACWLGTLKAGGVVVTTMTAWKAQELSNVMHRVRPQILVVDHRAHDDAWHAVSDQHVPPRVITAGGDDDELAAACAVKSTTFPDIQTAADDVAVLGATSGTTGTPKITMHFHRDILAIADTFARRTLKLGPEDVSAGTAPLAFTFGLGGLVVFPLRTGGSTVLMERPSPTELARRIDELGITVLYTAPTGYRAILKEGFAEQLGRLRYGISAGEHLSVDTFAAVEAASGLRLVDGIGSTEMLHIFISAVGDAIRPGATGRPIEGYRATILDDTGSEVAPGTPGYLAVIGPTGCRYLDDERQNTYVRNGWNITGDTYTMDTEGYFTFHMRSDSMIIASGYNVGAPEVEDAINQHPDVLECAVVGRPDTDKGMIINAFVVPREGVEGDDALTAAIIDLVKTRIAIFKCPRRIDYIDALPRNPSGKVQHFILRERARREHEAQCSE